MAGAMSIPVSIESVVHDAFRDLAQKIWDEHKIVVNQVSISWLEVSTYSQLKMIATDVCANTQTKG